MTKTFEVDTWDELQDLIAKETKNFKFGFVYTVTQNTKRASLPWVLVISGYEYEPTTG